MSEVNFLIKGGGRHEFSCGRIERMLRETCRRFIGLKPEDIVVASDGPISASGANCGPLQITVELSSDLLKRLAPPLEPEKDGSHRSDSGLRRFVQAMGETARRIGPENGWPQRQVEVRVPLTDVSWKG